MESSIQFSGFYESHHGGALDYALQQVFTSDSGDEYGAVDYYQHYEGQITEAMSGGPDFDIMEAVPAEYHQYTYHNQQEA